VNLGKNVVLLSDEEAERALEQLLRRTEERYRAGGDSGEALRFSLAEELAKGRPWPSWLLELAADSLLHDYEPKLKAQWERSPERQREQIDAFAKWLKARGVRAVRGEAEKIVAQLHGVTVHALRKRRQRRK
jgi:hypothetical protein